MGGVVEEKKLAEGMVTGFAGGVGFGGAGEDEKWDKGKGKADETEVDGAVRVSGSSVGFYSFCFTHRGNISCGFFYNDARSAAI